MNSARYKRLPYRREHSQPEAMEQFRKRICEALIEFGHKSLTEVEVEVHEGFVRLTGTVRSYYHKQLATAAVFSLDHDVQLQNRIQVTASPIMDQGAASLPETRII